MHASVHLECKVKSKKPLNRAQRIMRKNKSNFPTWYWRIMEDHSYTTITIIRHIPKAEVIVDSTGHVTFHALSMVPFGAPGTSVTPLEG